MQRFGLQKSTVVLNIVRRYTIVPSSSSSLSRFTSTLINDETFITKTKALPPRFINPIIRNYRYSNNTQRPLTSSLAPKQSQQDEENIQLAPTESHNTMTTSKSNSILNNNGLNTGDDYYEEALKALEQAQLVKKETETKRSKQMYDAWQKAKDANKDPKTQGVVVVKTIAKQTRKESKQQRKQKEPHNDDNNKIIKDETYWNEYATELLEVAANQYNHPIASVQLGIDALQEARKIARKTSKNKIFKSIEQQKDLVMKAKKLFLQGGLGGSSVGWFNLGQLLWSGFDLMDDDEIHNEETIIDDDESTDSITTGTVDEKTDPMMVILKPDKQAAMDAFTNAIELGDKDAMYFVGVQEMSSSSIEKMQIGLQLIQQAADSDHDGALYYLALLYLNGDSDLDIVPCSSEDFVKRLDEAVLAGNNDALYTRGHCQYYGSDGYTQSYKHSLNDFLLAAENGHADGAVSAGAMLHQGIDGIIQKDQRKAFELYQIAGELGSIDGWKNVIACYISGEGVPQSMEMAQHIADTMLKQEQGNDDKED